MKLAIIPARGGSKRIPGKNILDFSGKPMIAWSIEAALESGCFDEVIVSTDDEQIADVARSFGATTPFRRPDSLADDYTGTLPVIKHAVEWFLATGKPVDRACCIYATAPFITAADIQKGEQTLLKSGASYAFSVTTYAFPIQRALRLLEGERIAMMDPQQFSTRSQDLEEAWHDAGQFYWGTAEAWRAERVIFGQDSVAVPIPRYRVQDVDTLEDWESAEYLFDAVRARSRNN
ncbi:pseudaminic acid cytidylyltransferase [Marinobacter salinexigens]|uniref:Pseudaminic acid cytidylyltransferase n=1 Tax=Marinobacter salinexigens TaxID=2919747 RepID=A0A5B0VKS5_9GAMM|nr:pseudaminic acid cytidylyltransferase [Marinobacter salinexigens]KAA1174715.1 pseudaminic acid cytidylyltransferase [Marinobacter salinexigens]